MGLKWLKVLNPSSKIKERFYAVTHATAVFYGNNNESTVANELANVGAKKGAGTGSTQAVDSESVASGNYSNAYGKGNLAKHFNTIFGKWANDDNIQGAIEDSSSYGSLVAVGNGTSETSKSNALRLSTNGNLLIMGNYGTSGADYAEFFEWKDGNTSGEDRRGLFVTMSENKIKVASDGDYILGVVSAFPGVIGNADEDWQGRWMKDEYGALIVQNNSFVENPSYDSSKKYIPRSERKEWDAIGMLGVLVVRDDGTCEVNGYCKPTSGGIATYTKENKQCTYRVIERVNEKLVKIVFR